VPEFDPVFRKQRDAGQLTYIDSWLTADGQRCFQIMETDDHSLFSAWTEHWNDLVKFEIVELGERPQKDA
jgi:hypothetical protein